MATYHPSTTVRLQLRLEEGANVSAINATLRKAGTNTSPKDVVPSTEAGKAAALSRVAAEMSNLARQRASMSPQQYEERRARLAAQRIAIQTSNNADASNRPGALADTDPDDLVVIGEISPTYCKIHRNGLADADEFDMDLDFRDAPFDPRAIRSAFVEISMGVVPSDEFALGVRGGTVNGALTSQMSRGHDDDSTVRTKFFGFVDEWGVSFSEGDVVTLSGRSVETLPMTVDLPDDASIDLKRPLVEGVKNLLDSFVETQGMEVVFGNPGDPITSAQGPVPDAATPRASKARKGQKNSRARAGDRQKMKLWDHIVDVVGAVGYVAIVRGLRLYIADPRTFLLGESGALRVAYGANLDELEMTRNLGGTVKARTVEVRSYDPDVGKTRWARFPVTLGTKASGTYPDDAPVPSRANEVQPSGVATDDVVVIRIKGISDGKTLERTAASIFQQLGRQEIEGRFTTCDVTSLDGAEGDLLNLYPGDAVEILVTAPSVTGGASNLQELQAQEVARRADYLRKLGWPNDLAQKMAEVQQTVADEQTVFRVVEVSVGWTKDEGFELEVGFMNFLIAREEALDRPTLSPGSAAAAVAGNRSSLAADATRAASAAQQTLGARSQAGQISPDEFAAEGERSDQETRTAARGARSGA